MGPRGIEAMRNTIGGVTETQFPLYDGHGNLKALLHRGTGGTYSTSSWRQYDVWGEFLNPGQGANQSNLNESTYGHCASLGHPSDPLTGAIYMRARYYEPWTGRFISEDPARDGLNWFGYCGNDPVGHIDFSGRESIEEFAGSQGILAELRNIGVQTIDGFVYKVQNSLMVEVKLLVGRTVAGGGNITTQALHILRQWALGKNVNVIVLSFTTGSRAGERAVRLALDFIQSAGDRGDLMNDGKLSQIYWILQGHQ